MKNREKALQGITGLGFSPDEAEDMVSTFEKYGGMACLALWGGSFSFLPRDSNVLDVLLENMEV